jgi:dTDP-4-amino-4,6-dideoxygalactose transaminase
MRALTDANIAWDIHYPTLSQKMLGLRVEAKNTTPVAERLSLEKLSLPCFPTLLGEEVDFVMSVINQVLRNR